MIRNEINFYVIDEGTELFKAMIKELEREIRKQIWECLVSQTNDQDEVIGKNEALLMMQAIINFQPLNLFDRSD